MEMMSPMHQILFWMHLMKIHFVYLPTENKFCFLFCCSLEYNAEGLRCGFWFLILKSFVDCFLLFYNIAFHLKQ